MNQPINDGGQAFPRSGYDGPDNSAVGVDGMNIRTYMATKFMAAILANPASYTESGMWRNESETAAEEAVSLADALIEELSK